MPDSLAGLVEMDDSFFGPKGTKRGRGSERKSTVLCAISLYRDRRGEEHPGFAHMQVVDNASASTIEAFLQRLGGGSTTDERQDLLKTIRTDGMAILWKSGKKQRYVSLQSHPSRSKSSRKASPVGPPRDFQRQNRNSRCSPRCF